MPRSWRLVDSGLVLPPESAALDEAIMEAHVSGKVANTLHFYIRSIPTVSVGYFQNIGESVDQEECQRRGISIVRRRSGGSSIYTDRGQLIYGLVLHESDLPDERAASFRVICQPIADALRSFGIDAVYRPMNDIEVGGRKVSGSAQFRRKDSVLQHGTLIIDTDISQMDAVLKVGNARRSEFPRPSDRVVTLAGLLGRTPDMKEVKNAMISAMGKVFDAEFVPSSITDFEKSIVEKLVSERYSRREWNLKF
jgi:lipoate-protein ligase A